MITILLIPVNSKLFHNSLCFDCLIFIERPQQARRWRVGVRNMKWATERRWFTCRALRHMKRSALCLFTYFIYLQENLWQFSIISLAHIAHLTSHFYLILSECSHNYFILWIGNSFLVSSHYVPPHSPHLFNN